MKIFNTMTQKKEEFIPLVEGEARIYACGPTVYNFFHIGNARPFIVFDMLRRYLEYINYKVIFVQNFTDVDDKIIKKANEEGVSPEEISERFIEEYYRDADALGIKRATIHPKVCDNMNEIIAFIKTLEKKGFAYNVNGNVYYKVYQFEKYGKLSKQSLDDLSSGARVEVNDEKQNPLDFALWKSKKEGEPYWSSPWGEGRPGWHIECSVMSQKYLGDTFDIHGGGQDLIFPHHENEIAQSEACTGHTFANYWMHNGYINIRNEETQEDEKMSKSKGNFFTVRDISKKYDLEVIRLFILSSHYRSPISFSEKLVLQSQSGLERLYNLKEQLEFLLEHPSELPYTKDEKNWVSELSQYKIKFIEKMDDDLNTADAIAVIYELVKEINQFISEPKSHECLQNAYNFFMELTGVLNIAQKAKDSSLDVEIEKLIKERQQAKKDKNYARADEIRDELKAQGIILEDTREGVKWKRI
jgi:cysteinyl-tRNA synthetase